MFNLPAFAGWQLAWSDEFNGTSLDTNHWTFDLGNGAGGWGNNELEYYTSRPENVYVSDGLLHLVARKESFSGKNYTSAKLKTRGLFSHAYGRFEFRARLPQGQGYWPAIWMMPRDSVFGGWAASGEIDIVENMGRDPTTVLGTLHFGGQYPRQAQTYGAPFKFPAGDSVTNFHTYMLEWSTNSIQWSVDGAVYETQTNWWTSGGHYPAPFNQPFYLILNLAVGGNFGGNPNANTVFPGEMQMDYVRVYDYVPGQSFVPPASHRADIILDSGWQFIRHDVADAQNPGFDDSSWTSLNLPHTWNNLDGQDGGNDYYRGIGWYRMHYTVTNAYAGRHFFLKFDGAFSVANVWLNGNYLGEHQGGFAAFDFDATPYLKVGGDNVIAVKVNNSFNTNIPPLNADFTFFGGLYRDVHLLVTDPVQISPLDYASSGVYLKTTNVSASSADLQVTTVISNANSTAAMITVRATVTDAATNIVTVLTKQVVLPAASVSNVLLAATLANPHLWDGLADPYLYQVFVEIDQGTNAIDLVSEPLGFRSFSVDPANGFFLNGRHYDLHGVNMHQDWLNCGWALSSAQRRTNFMLLKEIGATALRLSHYEHDDETYRLADQNGLVVWSEIPLIDYITEAPEFYANCGQQLRELIRQRYNHPSVVCWSVYNEITLKPGPSTTNLIRQLVQIEEQEDPTRPSVAAANTSDNDPSTISPQLIAFNKYYGWYSSPTGGIGAWADNIHSNYPARCIGITEFGAGAGFYQHSENPHFPSNPSTPFHPEEWQNEIHEIHWQMMSARPYLWCKFVWNMFDFASDGRKEGDTAGRNDKGLVTYDRLGRKDAFYYYQANWTTNPMVYITGHTFTNRLTNAVIAKVYANCDSVELFLNGASQGTRTSSNCIYTWPVTLAPAQSNLVRAVGVKSGSRVSDSLVWMGADGLLPAATIQSSAGNGAPATQ